MPYLSDPDVTLYHGDCLEVLRTLPDASVDCCVTSPPYWGLRDYGVDGQLGLEQTPAQYVDGLVAVFAEVRRVLRQRGTLWLNLGDSYVSSPKGPGGDDKSTLSPSGVRHQRSQTVDRKRVNGQGTNMRPPSVIGLKQKDLVGIPWRVAFALQEAGWWLRCDVVWSKPNPMPESVTDRPTRSHEYVFLLSKAGQYHYDAAAIAEPARFYGPNGQPKSGPHAGQMRGRAGLTGGAYSPPGQSPHSNARPNKGQLPVSWEERKAAGATWGNARDGRPGTQRVVHGAGVSHELGDGLTRNARSIWEIQTQQFADAHFAVFPKELPRRCILAGCPEGGIVLDPFGGSGTTALVAREHGRKAVLIELNEDYCKLAATRLQQLSLLAEPA